MKRIIISLLFIQLYSSNSYSMYDNDGYVPLDNDNDEIEINIDEQPGDDSSPEWSKLNDEPCDKAYNKLNYQCLRLWKLLSCARCSSNDDNL